MRLLHYRCTELLMMGARSMPQLLLYGAQAHPAHMSFVKNLCQRAPIAPSVLRFALDLGAKMCSEFAETLIRYEAPHTQKSTRG